MRFGFGFRFGSRIRKDSDSEKFRFVLPILTSATLRAHPKARSLHSSEAGTRSFAPCARQHLHRPAEAGKEIFAAPACRTGICHGEVGPLSQKQLLLRFGPQPTQKCWQQLPTDELTLSRKYLFPPTCSEKGKRQRACFPLAHAQYKLKLKSFGGKPRRAPRRGARPLWGIHIQTKLTFICGINGVGEGVGFMYLY